MRSHLGRPRRHHATAAHAALLLAFGGASFAAPASAEELESTSGAVDYFDTGEPSANDLTVAVDSDDVVFVDSALISASGACSSSGIFSARCPAAGLLNVKFWLAGEDDRLDAATIDVPLLVIAGPGDDTAVGGNGPDGLAGSAGDDELHGGPGPDSFGDAVAGQPGGGADEFHGDEGDDSFVGAGPNGAGAGADIYDGGQGHDTFEYTAHAAASLVNLPGGVSHLGADHDALVSIERVLAGSGLDVLIGDGADNQFAGGGSSDILFGGDGADRLEGQSGGDRLEGGPGSDVLRGGADSDVVSYGEASGPVLVTLDNQPGDGQDGEHDDVGSDIERVHATPFADQITGNTAANVLQAGAGDDTVAGGEGDDDLQGQGGADHLIGGPGRDEIAAGPGSDDVEAGTGDDMIDVADGEADRVTCGIGIDTVNADRTDVLFGDCEVVAQPADPAPPLREEPAGSATPPSNPQVRPVVALDGSRVRVSRQGRGRVRVRCAGSRCAGTLVLKRRGRTIARAHYAVAAGHAATVPFRLTRGGSALLHRNRRLKVVAATGGVTHRYTLVLRRRIARPEV